MSILDGVWSSSPPLPFAQISAILVLVTCPLSVKPISFCTTFVNSSLPLIVHPPPIRPKVLLTGYCDSVARRVPLGAVKTGSRHRRLTGTAPTMPCPALPLLATPITDFAHCRVRNNFLTTISLLSGSQLTTAARLLSQSPCTSTPTQCCTGRTPLPRSLST
jgi:hypothetical protein